MLNDAELAAMRATTLASMPDTCTIKQLSLVSDGAGGQTETYTTRASGVACRVKPVTNANEVVQVSVLRGKQAFIVTLPYNQDVANSDQIVWSGSTLEVVAPYSQSWQLHKRVLCVVV